MDAIARVLARLVPKNIAGILGIIGTVIPLLKEVVVACVRLAAVFYPDFEGMIPKIVDGAAVVEKIWDNIKRFFLQMAPESLGGAGSPSG